MLWVGFEPTVPASARAKTVRALDRSATVTGYLSLVYSNFRPCTIFKLSDFLCCFFKPTKLAKLFRLVLGMFRFQSRQVNQLFYMFLSWVSSFFPDDSWQCILTKPITTSFFSITIHHSAVALQVGDTESRLSTLLLNTPINTNRPSVNN
jgi:hypothetical protein